MSVYHQLCQYYYLNRDSSMKPFGYNLSRKGQNKWQLLVDAGSIKCFLEKNHYDLVHTNFSFLMQVCDVLHMDVQEVSDVYEALKIKQTQLNVMMQPYIFVYTEFKRRNEPIFVLALMENLRHLKLEKSAVLESKDDGLNLAKQMVQHHFKKTCGTLPLWGKIISYHYHVQHNYYTLDTTGKRIETHKNPLESESFAIVALH